MFSFLIYLEPVSCILFILLSWAAADTASQLVYQENEKLMNQKTFKLLFWTISLTVPAALLAASDILLAAMSHSLFSGEWLIIRITLALAPIVFIWFGAFPRLRRLMKRTSGRSEKMPDVARRRQASDPGFIMPYQLTVLCSATLFFFVFILPVPKDWTSVTMPATIFLFICCMIVMLQTRQNQLAAAAPLIYHAWRHRFKTVGIVLTAAAAFVFITQLTGPPADRANFLTMLNAPYKTAMINSSNRMNILTYNMQLSDSEVPKQKRTLTENQMK